MKYRTDFGTGEITYLWLRQRGFMLEYPVYGPDIHMRISLPARQHDNSLELSPSTDQSWMVFFRNDDARRRGRFVFIRNVCLRKQLESLYFALSDTELPPLQEFDLGRRNKFADTFVQMGAEAEKHWADYCNSGFKKDVVWLEH